MNADETTSVFDERSDPQLRVLVLARSYPNHVFPNLGLWTEQPTIRLAQRCGMHVVSPVPWCPPLPHRGPFEQYSRFRKIPHHDQRHGVRIAHPRFAVGPGRSTYSLEARSYVKGITRTVDAIRKDFPFDLIHAHFIYPEGVAAQRLAERYDVPFVVTEHAPWIGWLEQKSVRTQAVPAARAAAMVMPVSSSVRASIQSFAGDSVRTKVVPVGVDTELYVPGEVEARRSDQILFVGFINFNKGVDVLLSAMHRLASQGAPGRLLLVGGSHYRNTRLQEQRLRDQASSLQLGDRLSFLGRRSPREVAQLMAQSSVVVLPSRAESFGAVLVEALACGTPVVATRCGGPEDIVVDGVGELVPVGEPVALADALSRVLAASGQYDRARLRQFALQRFGWNTIVDRIHDVYEEALERG